MGRHPKSAEVRGRFWTARASGATLREAARAAGVSRTAGHYWLKDSGGVRPRPRAPRPALRLSLAEREEISRGLAKKESLTSIAARLGRSVSTVSREVRRHTASAGYRAHQADRMADARTRRPRPGKLASTEALRERVEQGLKAKWSPQQISARLWVDFPDDPTMHVSHETIYTSLFVQAKGGLPGELTVHLRTRRVRRKAQRRVFVGPRRIADMRPLHARPAEVEGRLVIGHWEGDLIVGRKGLSHIGTLVERHSRYVVLLLPELSDRRRHRDPHLDGDRAAAGAPEDAPGTRGTR
uniref:IS30 family transposase, transposase, IS30 family n=1 Tax=uncultured actinobacterium Rifle_16ft_4_minimus_38826 TaxID=1665148 RepID=A0A0H4TST0_9ACTN|nr:IS30 family transposase, transposase, IS30 family [uncultured actinobacterium Rifle_16ft_4_minimus_38826]